LNIDLVFKIAAIGILIAVLNQLLVRAGRDDIALLTTIAGLIIVLLMVVDLVSNLFQSVKSIFGLY
jgi:stage III sporulation protein AC